MEEIQHAIRSWNPWWNPHYQFPSSIPREILPKILQSLKTPHIKDIIGIRRCGKSTLLKQIIAHLLKHGIHPKQILFLSLDDPLLKLTKFDSIIEMALQIHPEPMYLFLDEIQEKEGWELWLKKIYDMSKFTQIFISGSNAALLSSEISKALSGRHISFSLAPFSFKEFLIWNKWEVWEIESIKSHIPQLLHYFDKFLRNGSFPEVIPLDETLSHQLLVNLYNDIIYRDVAPRSVVDVTKLLALTNYIFTNFTREFSTNRIAKAVNLHFQTVENYLNLLQNAFLIQILPFFSFKQTVQFRMNKKVYVVDNGLRNAISFRSTRDWGKLAENIVFNALLQKEMNLFYWKDGKHEIDFVVSQGAHVKQLVQVCWDVSSEKTVEREIQAFITAKNQFPNATCLLLTERVLKQINRQDLNIEVLPISLWLITGSN